MVIFGSIPGLGWKIIGPGIDWYFPMQPPSEIYSQDFIRGIAGTFSAIIIGYLIVKWTKGWIKEGNSNLLTTFKIVLITLLACNTAFNIDITVVEIIGGLMGWHQTTGSVEFGEVLSYFGLMFIFNLPISLIPSVFNGLFAFFYLNRNG